MAAKNHILFVGAFDLEGDTVTIASSAAGNQVQHEICEALRKEAEHRKLVFKVVAFKPLKRWPHGPLFWPLSKRSGAVYFGYVNLPIFKQVIFVIQLLQYLVWLRPKILVKYNISFFEIICLLIYKRVQPDAYIAAIIQDVKIIPGRWFLNWLDKLSMRLAKYIDLTIPVSEKIADDFGFEASRVIIFRGGLTRQSRALLAADVKSVEPFAVFAGALEAYNGIDLIVERWSTLQCEVDLHIFGKGSCTQKVQEFAAHNPRVIYHGFIEEREINKWQSVAAINFCLRFSKDIDSGYFFPSKLFNVMCAPGSVFINLFDGLPLDLLHGCSLINDDLSNLDDAVRWALQKSDLEINRSARLKWIKNNADWTVIASEIGDRVFCAAAK